MLSKVFPIHYFYFILQLMTLPDADMNQILNHMGHTWEVHKTYYRHYDSIGERLDVAKLLMLQDQNKLNEYRQKGLKDIDVTLLHQAAFRGKVFIKHVRLCKSKIMTLSLACIQKWSNFAHFTTLLAYSSCI